MRFSSATALVLQALLDGRRHGFDIMDATGLASGTVYPILRRLHAEGLVRAKWETADLARREQRPPRRYYELTAGGSQTGRALVARLNSFAPAATLRPRFTER